MMYTEIEKNLKEIIEEVQTQSSLDCRFLKRDTVPAIDLPDFDSKIWIIVTSMLSEKTGIEIPAGENIFFDKDTKKPLDIEAISRLVANIEDNTSNTEEIA